MAMNKTTTFEFTENEVMGIYYEIAHVKSAAKAVRNRSAIQLPESLKKLDKEIDVLANRLYNKIPNPWGER